jgi:hypothetical protein
LLFPTGCVDGNYPPIAGADVDDAVVKRCSRPSARRLPLPRNAGGHERCQQHHHNKERYLDSLHLDSQLGYRVISPFGEGVTADQPLCCQSDASSKPVSHYGLRSILRACRAKTTYAGHDPGQGVLVQLYQTQRYSTHSWLSSRCPRARSPVTALCIWRKPVLAA